MNYKSNNRLDKERSLWELSSLGALVSVFSFFMATFTLNNLEQIEGESWNAISISLTILQTLLIFLAFIGFWMLRSAAKREAKNFMSDEGPCEIKSFLTKYLHTDEGKLLLAEIIQTPNVVALIHAKARELGLVSIHDEGDRPKIKNPSEKPNELQSRFWKDITNQELQRFKKPYDEGQFDE